MGRVRIAIARELTKLHEEVWRGSLSDAVAWSTTVEPRGEFVLVIDAAPEAPELSTDDIVDALRLHLSRGLSVKDASNAVALATGMSRRVIYELAHTLPRATLGTSTLNFPERAPM